MNQTEFIEALKQFNLELNKNQLQMLEKYCDLLIEYNEKTNLTAIKEKPDIYLKHFYDSLTIQKHIQKDDSVLDIGTGAGFPGMVLAIARPDLKITLLDSNNKKIQFLQFLKDELKIENVTLVHDRAEDFAKNHLETFDVVTSRAVAQLRVLCELSIPMLKINGCFIAMKGILDTEFDEAINTIRVLNSVVSKRDQFYLPIENSKRENLIILKKESCSAIYPRKYDKIIKNSL